jgi:hypothetical protein
MGQNNLDTPEEYIQSLTDETGKCDMTRFTAIKNAYRNELEIGEILSASGKEFALDSINFNPQRLSLLYTAAVVQTEAKIKDEAHLHAASKQLYEKIIFPTMPEIDITEYIEHQTKIVNDSLNKFKKGKLDSNNELYSLIEKQYIRVKERANQGLYIPGFFNKGETIDSAVVKLVVDKLYRKDISKKIEHMVEAKILEAIDKGMEIAVAEKSNDGKEHTVNIPLTKISTHKNKERETFILAGPPACGKGTINALFEIEAKNKGIAWDDVVKLNTDNHRAIVASAGELGPDITRHALLNNDEAYFITQETKKRLDEKIAKGKSPHIFLDTVGLSQEKINFGLRNEGNLNVKIITLKPEEAVKRAEARGKQTGRYVSVKYMLESHKHTGNNIISMLNKNKGQKIHYEVYDNDVPFGSLPVLVEEGDLRQEKIKIHSLERRGAIHGRMFINTAANPSNITDLYGSAIPARYNVNLDELKSNGYRIEGYQNSSSEDVQSYKSNQQHKANDFSYNDLQYSKQFNIPISIADTINLARIVYKIGQNIFYKLTDHEISKSDAQKELAQIEYTLKESLNTIKDLSQTVSKLSIDHDKADNLTFEAHNISQKLEKHVKKNQPKAIEKLAKKLDGKLRTLEELNQKERELKNNHKQLRELKLHERELEEEYKELKSKPNLSENQLKKLHEEVDQLKNDLNDFSNKFHTSKKNHSPINPSKNKGL